MQSLDGKIVLTGGHGSTSALAVVEELRRTDKYKHLGVYWIGPRYSMEGKKNETLAFRYLPKLDVDTFNIVAGRLLRKINQYTLISLIKFPIGFIHALYLLFKIKPRLILSFGGYAGFPVVVIGWLLRIPVILMDETYSFNTANRLSIPFANKILVSRKESLKYYPKAKTIRVGNPILRNIVKIEPKKKLPEVPHLYVTGGSAGATSLNYLIKVNLNKLLKDFKITHQTGELSYKEFNSLKGRLPLELNDRYKVIANISPFKIHSVYKSCDMIISRSGANTVSEIILTKRPAVLAPLIIGNWNEQERNALYAREFGIARIFYQKKYDAKQLLEMIYELRDNWEKIMDETRSKRSPDRNAAKKIVENISNELT